MIGVDGWTCPNDSRRFCLGIIRSFKHDLTVDIIKRQICNGIEIVSVDGKVVVRNLCDYSIFLRSEFTNARHHAAPGSVQKVNSGFEIDVFDQKFFGAAVDLAKKTNLPEGYEKIYSLKELCSIYVSFVKGWGCGYKRRELFETPIWLEIKLVRPLQDLDKILQSCSL